MDIRRERNHGTSSHGNTAGSGGSDEETGPALWDDEGSVEPMDADFRGTWDGNEHDRRSPRWQGECREIPLHCLVLEIDAQRQIDRLWHLSCTPAWPKTSLPFGRAGYVSFGSSDSSVGTLAMATDSAREILFSSRLNLLVIFVPAGVATYMTKCPPPWIFGTNAMAIIPLSALLTDATERIAADAGDTIGALLNISLGNLVELILL